jgi:curved DNA-binding protein CbpA
MAGASHFLSDQATMSSLSHYEVLSLQTNATADDIKTAYKKLALALQ